MRLGPPGTDSGALSRSRNRQVNPLDAPPHPKKSFYLTPISTPMQYQAIILALRCPLTSICRGTPGQSHWNQSELVQKMRSVFPLSLMLPAAAWAALNVHDFGAKGNGIADDAAAIQKAIDVAQTANQSQMVFFPSGTYLVRSSIQIRRSHNSDTPYLPVRLTGEGKRASVVQAMLAATAAMWAWAVSRTAHWLCNRSHTPGGVSAVSQKWYWSCGT